MKPLHYTKLSPDKKKNTRTRRVHKQNNSPLNLISDQEYVSNILYIYITQSLIVVCIETSDEGYPRYSNTCK